MFNSIPSTGFFIPQYPMLGSNNMLSMLMMNSIMANPYMPSYYYSFSKEGAGGAQTTAQKPKTQFESMRQSMDQLGLTSANGYSLTQSDDGKITFHYSKNGKEYTASNMTELLAQVNTPPEQTKQFSLEDRLVVNSDDNTDESVKEPDDTDDSDETIKKDDTAANDSNKLKYKRGKLHPNYLWSNYGKLPDDEKSKLKKGMSLRDVITTLCPAIAGFTDERLEKTYQLMRDANPTAIKNDKLVKPQKLDLIIPAGTKYLPENSKVLNNKYAYNIDEEGSITYFKPNGSNGTWLSCTPEEFKKHAPQTYKRVCMLPATIKLRNLQSKQREEWRKAHA